MSEQRIHNDVAYLAGSLPHRKANSENERAAAGFILERLRGYTPNSEIDDFYSAHDPWYLFASYYGEFCIVSLVATWWPRIALCYGAAVFLAYLAEFSGYHVLGRLVPHYETQNVAARFLSPRPKRLFVVTAHYDAGRTCPLMTPRTVGWLGGLHFLVVALMLLVVASCATQALGIFEDAPMPYDVVLRWAAALGLLAAAAALFYCDATAEPTRGANDNASGVAALLRLAERFANKPLDEADVYLVATGSGATWMNGIRHFITTHPLDREHTYFLDLDSVGAGALCYTTSEGMLQPFPSSKEMVTAAQSLAREHRAAPCRSRRACSDALLPLARGYKALTVTARDSGGLANDARRRNDTLLNVDSELVARAADFAEAILRRLEADLP